MATLGPPYPSPQYDSKTSARQTFDSSRHMFLSISSSGQRLNEWVHMRAAVSGFNGTGHKMPSTIAVNFKILVWLAGLCSRPPFQHSQRGSPDRSCVKLW